MTEQAAQQLQCLKFHVALHSRWQTINHACVWLSFCRYVLSKYSSTAAIRCSMARLPHIYWGVLQCAMQPWCCWQRLSSYMHIKRRLVSDWQLRTSPPSPVSTVATRWEEVLNSTGARPEMQHCTAYVCTRCKHIS
jgi:hypothetical protein